MSMANTYGTSGMSQAENFVQREDGRVESQQHNGRLLPGLHPGLAEAEPTSESSNHIHLAFALDVVVETGENRLSNVRSEPHIELLSGLEGEDDHRLFLNPLDRREELGPQKPVE